MQVIRNRSVSIGNTAGSSWVVNRGFGSTNRILFDRPFVLFYHPDKALHDS